MTLRAGAFAEANKRGMTSVVAATLRAAKEKGEQNAGRTSAHGCLLGCK